MNKKNVIIKIKYLIVISLPYLYYVPYFHKNIVYNPKDSASYLYLAKIFKIEEDKRQEEKNIKTTLLLDPKNEEAMYLLIDMELERSNFSKADELSKDFKKICIDMCEKIALIESRLKDFERKDAS